MLIATFVAANILLYVSNAYLYFWSSGFVAIKPLYWYFFTLVVGAGLIVTHRSCWAPSRAVVGLLVWASAFTAIVAVSYFLSRQSPQALQSTILYLEATLLMAVMAVVFQAGKARYWAGWMLVVCVLFAVVANVADFFSLTGLTLGTTKGRAAGLYGNPNLAGKTIVIAMVLAIQVLARRQRFPFCVVAGLGVALTFSRSAMLLWAVAVFGLSWYRAFVLPRLPSLALISAVFLVLAATLAAGQWLQVVDSVGLGDRLNENTQARIGTGFLSQDDHSSEERVLVAREGFRLFLEAPIFGHGIGATQEWNTLVSIHNMYALLGAEQGVIGIALYLWLVLVMWRSGCEEAKIIAVLYAVSGLFSHNNFEQPAILMLVALAVACAGKEPLAGFAPSAAAPRAARPRGV